MSVMFINERTAQRTSHRAIAIDWYKSGDNITTYIWNTATKKWQFSIGLVHA